MNINKTLEEKIKILVNKILQAGRHYYQGDATNSPAISIYGLQTK